MLDQLNKDKLFAERKRLVESKFYGFNPFAQLAVAFITMQITELELTSLKNKFEIYQLRVDRLDSSLEQLTALVDLWTTELTNKELKQNDGRSKRKPAAMAKSKTKR